MQAKSSNQRHNFTQAQKRKTDCRCRRCAAPVFQEYGFQPTSLYTYDRRRVRQALQLYPSKIHPLRGYAKNMAVSGAYPLQSSTFEGSFIFGSNSLQRSLKQSLFNDFLKNPNRWTPKFQNCGEKMTFVCCEEGPPKENEVFGCKLPDWNYPMLSQSCN